MRNRTDAQIAHENRRDPNSLVGSFLAGFEPTGAFTFDRAQTSKNHGSHQLAGILGGAIGGMTLLPSLVYATIAIVSKRGALATYMKSHGLADSIRRISAVAVEGGKKPYTRLADAYRAKNVLADAEATGRRLTKKDMQALSKITPISEEHAGDIADKLLQAADKKKEFVRTAKGVSETVDSKVKDIRKGVDTATDSVEKVTDDLRSRVDRLQDKEWVDVFDDRIDAAKNKVENIKGNITEKIDSGKKTFDKDYGHIKSKANKAYNVAVDIDDPLKYKDMISKAREKVTKKYNDSLAMFAAAGALSATSAGVQYGQGRGVGNTFRRNNIDPYNFR